MHTTHAEALNVISLCFTSITVCGCVIATMFNRLVYNFNNNSLGRPDLKMVIRICFISVILFQVTYASLQYKFVVEVNGINIKIHLILI